LRKNGTKIRVLFLIVLIGAALVAFVLLPRRGQAPLPPNARADFVLVEKASHTMTLFEHGQPIRTYRIALGRGGLRQKLQAGDNKVPEGMYRIAGRNPKSTFHRALRISYPLPEQEIQARQRGLAAGGDIMIHGIRNGLGWIGSMQRRFDWTKGCIAVDDAEIEEIWRVVPDGTPIEIRP
jgi:murein L,D-transpeptidase YafK